MKFTPLVIAASALAISACATPPKPQVAESSEVVGYNKLTKTFKKGQRVQLVSKTNLVLDVIVDKLSGDYLYATDAKDSKKKMRIDLNGVSKIRVYE